ncbi:MAG: phospholipase A [Aquisalimonadaceae bacterium]
MIIAVLWSLPVFPVCASSDDSATPSSTRDATALDEPFRLPKPSINDLDEGFALAANEPIYFVVGGNLDNAARLQYSFQYRIFDKDSSLVQNWPWLERMHFGYTQTLLWDLLGDSAPFTDSSHRPSFYWQSIGDNDGTTPDFLRIGYEHESNGKEGVTSRSVDSAFFHPGWLFHHGEQQLLIAPRFRFTIAKSGNNRDIDDFHGHVALYARYGNEASWVASALLRQGAGRKRSVQLDISYPLRKPIFARTGGFFYVQLFHGYGETLLTYDQHSGTQVRIGLAIVR